MPVTSATVQFIASVVETLAAANTPGANAPIINHDKYCTRLTLPITGGSPVPVTTVAAFSKSVTTSGSIDMTALPGTNGVTVDGSGLKLQVLRIRAATANTNTVTIAKGASNGYIPGAGSAFSVTLAAGQEFMIYGNEASADVSASVKVLDITCTGAQVLEVVALLG